MLLESARKKFNEINEGFEKNGSIEFDRVDKFLIEFTELLDKNFSQANTSLFSNLIILYIQTEPKQKCFKDLLHWIKIYIEIMEETPESIYDTEPIKTI
jgi:hypothetical protein